jgi:hypothetical protein
MTVHTNVQIIKIINNNTVLDVVNQVRIVIF